MSLAHLQGVEKVIAPLGQLDVPSGQVTFHSHLPKLGRKTGKYLLSVNCIIKRANYDFQIYLYQGQTKFQVFFALIYIAAIKK